MLTNANTFRNDSDHVLPISAAARCSETGLPQSLWDQVERVVANDVNILLEGETGTGKTRLARMIHERSPRWKQPFLVVNCGALSESISESELFGHVKGSFTGADRERVGKFAEAGEGTLFLDEVDSLTPGLQAKLLRVIEDRLFEAVGSNHSQTFRARLIVASNRPLAKLVAEGTFRSDLFYRLNVVGFELPPLRQQPDMIPGLVRYFLREFAAHEGLPPLSIEPDAMEILTNASWPGNIRQLRNVLERAVVLRHGMTITRQDFPAPLVHGLPEYNVAQPAHADTVDNAPASQSAGHAHQPLIQSRELFEKERIIAVLKENRNNRSAAARNLGISRVTLYKKIEKYGLDAQMPSRVWHSYQPSNNPMIASRDILFRDAQQVGVN